MTTAAIKDLSDLSVEQHRQLRALGEQRLAAARARKEAEKAATEEEEAAAEPAPFPVECLPNAPRRMAQAISATAGVPLSLSGPVCLGTLSGAIGKGAFVASGPDRTSRANLYVLVSGESGCGKSEAYRHAMGPLYAAEAEMMEEFKRDRLPEIEADREVLSARIDIAKRDMRSRKGDVDGMADRHEAKETIKQAKQELAELEATSNPPRLICEDVTVERLATLLAENGETIFSASSDAGALVNNWLGRYNPTKRTDEGLYLKAWTGEPVRVDRKSMAKDPVMLLSPCMAGTWLTQPDKVVALLGEVALSDGGFLPRILAVNSRAELLYDEDRPGIPAAARAAWDATLRRLLALRKNHADGVEITVSPEAREELRRYYNAIVDRRKGELRDVGPYAARWAEQAWRLCVVLHCGGDMDASLSAQTAKDAVKLASWFSDQQLGILQAGRSRKREERVDRLVEILHRHKGERTLRLLGAKHGFAREEIEALTGEFPSLLEIVEVKTAGRSSHVLRLKAQSARI